MAVACLIVDDSRPFLRATRNLLEREEITVVGTATTSAEALRKARTLRPDVMLVDIGLDRESGFDLAREIAGAPEARRPGVILISGYAEDDFADMIAASPALAFLPKSDVSGQAIRHILAAAGRGPGREASAG